MYEIIWNPTAFGQMDAIIRDNPNRVTELAAALRKMTVVLRLVPELVGELRTRTNRVEFFDQLTVFFRPNVTTRKVYITKVRLRKS